MRFSALVGFLALAFALLACQRETPPPLIQVLDFAPREAEVGDKLELSGTGFPQGKSARLAFRGTLRRPGEKPVSGVEIEATGLVTAAQTIELVYTEHLEQLFCGAGDRARHTTFEGEIDVSFAALVSGAPPLSSTLEHVTLDFRPPNLRPSGLAQRARDGERALAFLGIHASSQTVVAGGLLVEAVDPGSRAERAGIRPGDLLASFEGVRVTSAADTLAPPHARSVLVGLRRGREPEETREVSIDGFKPGAPTDLFAAMLLLAFAALAIFLFVSPWGSLAPWLRALPLARGSRAKFKLFRVTPGEAAWVALPATAALSAVPFLPPHVAVDMGIVFLVSVTTFVTLGALGVATERARLTGAMKAAAESASDHLPASVAVVTIVMTTGSLRLQEIVFAQGGAPWDWSLFRTPCMLALFLLFFAPLVWKKDSAAGVMLEGARTPTAKTTGARLLAAASSAHLFLMCAVAAALFLGGWQLPGLVPGEQEAVFPLQLLGGLGLGAKTWLLFVAVGWLRSVLPALRPAESLRLVWSRLVPMSLAAGLLTVGWLALSPSPASERLVAALTLVLFALLALQLAQHLRPAAGRGGPLQARLNPFL